MDGFAEILYYFFFLSRRHPFTGRRSFVPKETLKIKIRDLPFPLDLPRRQISWPAVGSILWDLASCTGFFFYALFFCFFCLVLLSFCVSLRDNIRESLFSFVQVFLSTR